MEMISITKEITEDVHHMKLKVSIRMLEFKLSKKRNMINRKPVMQSSEKIELYFLLK